MTRRSHSSSSIANATTIFDPIALTRLLKRDAKALGIPAGAAEIFITKTVTDVQTALSPRKLITKNDIDRLVYKELKKYHPDFAYVYQNRDTII